MAAEDIQGNDQTKLANGGGAFPFWVSVLISAGVIVLVSGIVFAIVYGIIQLF